MLLLFSLAATSSHAQQLLSSHETPTSPQISAQEQIWIDEDIENHLGDVPIEPGPKANLSPALQLAEVRKAIRLVADWELQRSQPYFERRWTWNVLYTGFMAASRALEDPRYSNAMLAFALKYDWQMGAEDPSGRGWPASNDQALAQTYLELYLLAPSSRKLVLTHMAFDDLFSATLPPVPEGQFPIWWQWCDALFMAPPAWARLAAITHDSRYLDYMDQRWLQTSDALYNTQYHLFYRDKTFIHKVNRIGKPVFWSRGNGWVAAGLARTLEYMPADYPARSRYETQLRELAAEFASLQDANSGLWHSDLLDAADYPAPEVTGSALIVTGIAWGVNNGVLDRATYTPVVAKAWRGLVSQIYANGRLGSMQQTGNGPNYYMPSSSYNFGIGAFLLAGEQVERLSESLSH